MSTSMVALAFFISNVTRVPLELHDEGSRERKRSRFRALENCWLKRKRYIQILLVIEKQLSPLRLPYKEVPYFRPPSATSESFSWACAAAASGVADGVK